MSSFNEIRAGGLMPSPEEADKEWESIVVRYIFDKSGNGGLKRKALSMINADPRRGKLTWESLEMVFPNFPYKLFSSRLLNVEVPDGGETRFNYRTELCPKYYEPVRFRHFTRTPVYGLFNELRKGYSGGKPVGLIYPFQGFKNGMIIHNDRDEVFWQGGSAWVFKGTEANPDRVYLEPFVLKLEQFIRQQGSWF